LWRREFRRWPLYSLLAAVLLLSLTYTFRRAVLDGIGRFLIVSDPIEAGDVIFLLNGDLFTRPQYAAALFHRGLAPYVMIARAEESAPVKAGVYPNITDSGIAVLKSLLVPPPKIIELETPAGVKHTVDEARAFRSFCLRNHHVRRVIVVTTALYSRRAKLIFGRVLRGIPVQVILAPVPESYSEATNWWATKDGRAGCGVEYAKLLFYWLVY
jgi:uncharacterized SAM-binding protein YcdF (DUF218 family)